MKPKDAAIEFLLTIAGSFVGVALAYLILIL